MLSIYEGMDRCAVEDGERESERGGERQEDLLAGF